MSAKPTIIGRAVVVTQSAGKRAVPVGVLVALLTAATGYLTSLTKHDSSDTIRREMHGAMVTLSAKVEKQDDLIRELQITVAVLEDRWESEGADTVATVDRLPPPRPRMRLPPIQTYDDLLRDLDQREAE